MLVAVRDKMAALKQQGGSLDENIAARPTAAYETKWAGFVIDWKTFNEIRSGCGVRERTFAFTLL
jgi:hypothetical protein